MYSKASEIAKSSNLNKNGDWPDCIFIFRDAKLAAHKLILSCKSPVFESMLYGSLASSEIHINDIEAEDFEQMLKYVYTDTIVIKSIINAWSLFYISQKYFINNLKIVCTDYINFNLTVSTLLLSYEYAKLYNLQQLMNKCWRDILLTTKEVLQSDYHMQASTFCSLLDENEINARENDLIEAASKWAEDECQKQNLDVTKENKFKILKKFDIFSRLRFACLGNNYYQYLCELLEYDIENVDEYVHMLNPSTSLRQRMPYHIKYRFRETYKIERNIMLDKQNQFCCTITANQNVIVYGIAISPPHQDGFQAACSNVLISVIDKSGNLLGEVKDFLKVTSDYENPYLFNLPDAIKFEERTPYTVLVKYIFDSDLNKPNELLCFYLNSQINTYANSTTLCFKDHLCGGIIRGISFYVL